MDQAAIIAEVNNELAGSGWMVASIEITATQQMARDDERVVAQEFVATARAMETFFAQTERTDTYLFVVPVTQPGDRFDLEGEAITYTAPGVTEQRVRLFDLRDLAQQGRLLAHFYGTDRTVVVEGTPEADTARAAIEQARAEAEAAARAEAERLNALYGGAWVSLSRCGTIDFEHHFTLEPGEDQGRFTGEVSYRPIYPSPPFELGSHTVNARIDTRRDRLVIEHGSWIERPQGNRGVTITLAAEGGDDGAPIALTGESPNMLGVMASGNCSYRLQRPDAFQAEREQTLAPVRALTARMQQGVWIDGSQTGPERDGRTDWPVRVRVSTITDNYIVATAELQAFHANSRRLLGIVEYPFAVFLTRGIENAHIEWGRRPRPRGGDMRNLFTRSNFCTALRITLDAETGVVSGSNNDRQGCIDEIRLPLVP
ncbi:MAG: hypothetical protein JJU19_02875 [Pararhodobacter sp.]|nr:hypothetical protein [Pararhodobacter sp.]